MILHKRYKFCPECQSVMIRRIHRGWFQKHILRQKPKYGCGNCKASFFTPLFEKDLIKRDEEKSNIHYETKPTISVAEVDAIDIVMAEKKEKENEKLDKTSKAKNDEQHEYEAIEVYDSYDLEKEFQATFQKGFDAGFAQGLKKEGSA